MARPNKFVPNTGAFRDAMFQNRAIEPAIRGTTRVVHTFLVANANHLVRHRLGAIPEGFRVTDKSAACDVYRGTGRSTRHTISLKSTFAPVTVTIEFF